MPDKQIAHRKGNPATASAFADWVFEKTDRREAKENYKKPSRIEQQRLELGIMTHEQIDLFLQHSWAQEYLGETAKSDWKLSFSGNKKEPNRIFSASKLTYNGAAIRCVPDAVLTNRIDDSVIVIERKTTFVREVFIPRGGWPNVEAQLWCYSWIDDFKYVPRLILIGQLWRREYGAISLCHRHPAWHRGDPEHEKRCGEWFREYGGLVNA